ncbi:isoprenylcysteine carboxylmethyltransferase family protein [Novosphingobium sp. ZN18A2]|uniref:methanethiol S-methyltransferase n=1 Tax=Novosphingobium sp. ZN18A2 TaxID=3079861 RepID=UPI0030D566B9
MSRVLGMLTAVLCYFAFFAAFAYFVGFLAGIPELPTNIDKGLVAPAPVAAVIDVALIAFFGIQHSVMARSGFKAAWTRIVPVQLERSVYCLGAAVALAILFAFWHPIDRMVWNVTSPAGQIVLWALFLGGIGVVFISTWLINHFELFGLAQAWSHVRNAPMPDPRFVTPLFYRAVRHPIYTGFFIALWATPHMTAGHVLFAAGMTVYLLIGIRYEERDLVKRFGSTYVEYRASVGMIIPGVGRRTP